MFLPRVATLAITCALASRLDESSVSTGDGGDDVACMGTRTRALSATGAL